MEQAERIEKLKQRIIKLALRLYGDENGPWHIVHNRSYAKLYDIFEEIKEEEFAPQLYYELLYYPDYRVQTEVAQRCVELNRHVDEAKTVMQQIADLDRKTLSNRYVSFDAKMILAQWKYNNADDWFEKMVGLKE